MSKHYLNSIQEAIDVPLMDVNNISKLILSYIEKKLYVLHYYTRRHKHDYFMFDALILADSPEECWEEWLFMRETVDRDYKYCVESRLTRDTFLKHLTLLNNKPYYSATQIQYARIEEFERGCILEYKRPTKKVIKKSIINKGIKIETSSEHDFSMLPFYNIELRFDPSRKALYYREYIKGEYFDGYTTGRELPAVWIL